MSNQKQNPDELSELQKAQTMVSHYQHLLTALDALSHLVKFQLEASQDWQKRVEDQLDAEMDTE